MCVLCVLVWPLFGAYGGYSCCKEIWESNPFLLYFYIPILHNPVFSFPCYIPVVSSFHVAFLYPHSTSHSCTDIPCHVPVSTFHVTCLYPHSKSHSCIHTSYNIPVSASHSCIHIPCHISVSTFHVTFLYPHSMSHS